jgi:hypothetical protein
VIDQAQLAESLGRLDPGTRALLDLSLRRAIPDDQVAKVLGVDASSIPPRRAQGIAQLADMMDVPGPAELAALLIAIPELPEEAWGVPTPAPFSGSVSSARRAKALRRVAVAASPLVAVGAVMAAVVVASSSSDNSGSGSGAGGAGAGSRAAVTAPAPEARHGLPPGVQLAHARRPAHKAAHHRARRAHHRHASGAEPAILARQPADTVENSVPVAYHPPAAPQQPQGVTHHHHTQTKKPQASPQPAPAPVQTPSPPVSTPAPVQTTSPVVQVSPPTQNTTTVHGGPYPESGSGKENKTPPPQPNLDPPSGVTTHGHGSYRHGGYGSGNNNAGGGGGCGHDDGGSYSHGSSEGHHGGEGNSRSFHPPGLFRKHH